jgi:hypothetical protein
MPKPIQVPSSRKKIHWYPRDLHSIFGVFVELPKIDTSYADTYLSLLNFFLISCYFIIVNCICLYICSFFKEARKFFSKKRKNRPRTAGKDFHIQTSD